MDTLENSAKLSIERAEKLRRQLGVTQRFMDSAIGQGKGTWGYWVNGKGDIPAAKKGKVVEAFVSLSHIANGKKVLPVNDQGEIDNPAHRFLQELPEVLDIIWNHIEPALRNTILKRTTKSMLDALKADAKELAQ